MISPHQEEVELLKTVILFLRLPQPPHPTTRHPHPTHPYASRDREASDSLPEVTLDALKTYITHCFAGWRVFLRALGPHLGGGLSACR